MENIKFRGIPQQKDEIPRLNAAAKFRGHKNFAARLEIPRAAENCEP